MRFKLDENLGERLVVLLAGAEHDVDTVVQERLQGASDQDVWAASRAADRTLITLDLDFSNPLRFPTAGTPGIVVLRPPRPFPALIESLLAAAQARLWDGSVRGRLWIIEPGRIRQYTPVGVDED